MIIKKEVKKRMPPPKGAPGLKKEKLKAPQIEQKETTVVPSFPVKSANALTAVLAPAMSKKDSFDFFETEEYLEITDEFPSWADRPSAGSYQEFLTQLMTRDGRKIGNALVISDDEYLAEILTDAGNRMIYNSLELIELFHKPEWIMSHTGCSDWVISRKCDWASLPIRFPE